ncbi:hypothetical protein [Rhodococcus maanshanensis]|uniref:Uncharacterized protein n=1 Tax=Rhodococcus maanshanensis TaxID=183556 RepID=A0A1H7SD86_9NOCA|nr:hypothetical protein [Rhodococcus maanshanensis]SEL69694.1 hypothetical protein SAMN05444583_11313 [Rhodococcus maanshanensis]
MYMSLRSPARSLLLVFGAVAIVAVGGGVAAQADELPPPCMTGPAPGTDCWTPPKHRGTAFAPERLQTVVPDRAVVPPRGLHDRAIVPRPQPTPGCGAPLVFCL